MILYVKQTKNEDVLFPLPDAGINIYVQQSFILCVN
jgi:hypothetical protein